MKRYQMGFDQETMDKVQGYMDFIVKRASGETMTTAKWMRKFVANHKDYKQDSIVSESIAHDLMVRCNEIGLGKVPCPEVLGDVRITAIARDAAYNVELGGANMTDSKVHMLLQRYAVRAEKIRRQKLLAQAIVEKESELAALKQEFEDIMVDEPADEEGRVRLFSFSEAGKADASRAGGGRERTTSTNSNGSAAGVDDDYRRARSNSDAPLKSGGSSLKSGSVDSKYLASACHGHSHGGAKSK